MLVIAKYLLRTVVITPAASQSSQRQSLTAALGSHDVLAALAVVPVLVVLAVLAVIVLLLLLFYL